jgi:hypothetical protein
VEKGQKKEDSRRMSQDSWYKCSSNLYVWNVKEGVWGLGFGVWGLGFGVWVFAVADVKGMVSAAGPQSVRKAQVRRVARSTYMG